jgi:hypothetical protein
MGSIVTACLRESIYADCTVLSADFSRLASPSDMIPFESLHPQISLWWKSFSGMLPISTGRRVDLHIKVVANRRQTGENHIGLDNMFGGPTNRSMDASRCPMSIEDAIARDLVAVLFVTFLFGGGTLWLIVATVMDQWRKVRVSERNASLKQSMIEGGYRADEIVRVLNAGGE